MLMRFHFLTTIRLSLSLAVCCCPGLALAQNSRARVPVTGTMIAEALQAAGLSTSPARIEVPGSLSAMQSNPEVLVVGAEALADKRLRVRLACKTTSSCLPFFAIVDVREEDGKAEAFLAAHASHSGLASARLLETSGMRAGDQALLVLENVHMHIELPVLLIDSGTVGGEVRVSSLDRKKTFRGVVVNSQLVKGNLP